MDNKRNEITKFSDGNFPLEIHFWSISLKLFTKQCLDTRGKVDLIILMVLMLEFRSQNFKECDKVDVISF